VPATFTQQSGDAIWSLDGGPPTCTVAYAPFDPTGVPTSGVALADTWSTYPGTYVVLPHGTALTSSLADRLTAYLGWQEASVRFVWVPDPTAAPRSWRASSIAFAGAATTGLNGLGLGSFALWVGGGCEGAPNGQGDAIVLTAPAGTVAFTAGFGAFTFPGTAPTVTVQFAGPTAGCATTGVTLVEAGGAFEQLDVGLRFSAPAPTKPAPLFTDRLVSYRYPIFSTSQPSSGASVPATVSLDPAAPFDSTRTYLGLVPDGSAHGPQLATYYRTTNRLYVRLTPLATPAGRLVPAVRALTDAPSPADPLYLVPCGAFAVDVVDAGGNPTTGTQQLMCGTSGIEYVEVPPSGSELWFTPGGAALVGDQGLTAVARTAYTSAFGPGGAGGLLYRAQPDSAALFAATSITNFLGFNKLPGVTLHAAPHDGTLPAGFPMAPYAGIVDAELAPYKEIEQKALAPTRRKNIGGAGTLASMRAASAADGGEGNGATAPTVTPQGLLAGIDGSGIAQLTLLVSGNGPVQIGAVTPALAGALQANQLFLVASAPEPLSATGEVDGAVTIPPEGPDQWTIDAWPADWSKMGTLLVMKFAGKTLRALADDTSTWADKDTFNPGRADAAQATLRAAIDEAVDRAKTDPEFRPFAKLAEDPLWQGVLVLNAPIPPGKLPTELAGLAAGIDTNQFKAHHLGLTVTPVDASGGAPAQKLSSLFGLIFYESTTSAVGAKGPYAFNVLTLKVRFENSSVATFSSRIQLLVDELFGEPATRTDATTRKPCADNVLLLYGVYQKQGATSGYTFSTDQDNVFVMTSGVLSTVEVATAQFVTVVAPADAKPPAKPAESAFILTGALRFLPAATSDGFDLFSFGPDGTDPLPLSPQRLTYSNLVVALAYVPGDVSKDVYTFDATKVVMDAAQSPARATGVFNDFPLTLSSFVHVQPAAAGAGTTPATPTSLGFAGVDAPALPQGSIAAPWFGIVADLGLGTAGALAAQAGFKASLLAAWAPGKPASPNVGLGLRLPGTGTGGKLLSLESVLKLKVGDISFVRDENAYVLALQQIALSLLTLTFPPGGQIDALLFADPTGRDHTTLGWYAGYAKTGGK
jgi:hypothetical protein